MEQEQKKDVIKFTKEELGTYVELSVKQMRAELSKARCKPNYQRSNPFENLLDGMGVNAQDLIREYELIQKKESKLPSGQRTAIRAIVGQAIQNMLRAKVNLPKPDKTQEKVKVLTPSAIANLPEGSHLRVSMPEAPYVPVVQPTSSSKKRKKK